MTGPGQTSFGACTSPPTFPKHVLSGAPMAEMTAGLDRIPHSQERYSDKDSLRPISWHHARQLLLLSNLWQAGYSCLVSDRSITCLKAWRAAVCRRIQHAVFSQEQRIPNASPDVQFVALVSELDSLSQRPSSSLNSILRILEGG